MTERKINIAEIQLTDAEVAAATEVLKSGALRQGPHCSAFEEEFAQYVGAKYCVTCANGSASLHLAYMSFLQPGDEVLVPSMTFIATASMVVAAGGVPIFVETDPETLLIDMDDARCKVTDKTKAISPVHLFGNAVPFEPVEELAKEFGLKIVWDAAQAHGTQYNGVDVGSRGDFVSWSFYPSKNMFVGEGGIISTDNAEVAQRLKDHRSHGQTGKYYHTIHGLNYRMTDVEAAIGREQLKRLDSMLETRRRNAMILNEGLSDVPEIRLPRQTPNSKHSWHQYAAMVEDCFGSDKETVREKLAEKGVATGIAYPRGLHQQPVFGDQEALPITEDICSRIINLPVHHGLTEDDCHYVVDAVKQVASKKK